MRSKTLVVAGGDRRMRTRVENGERRGEREERSRREERMRGNDEDLRRKPEGLYRNLGRMLFIVVSEETASRRLKIN